MKRIAAMTLLCACAWIPAQAQWFDREPSKGPLVMWPSPGQSESFLGVYLSEVTPELADMLSIPEERGAHVNQVIVDSPAFDAGLETDDVILGWNQTRVESARQLTRLVRETPPGRIVTLEVFRKGDISSIEVKVGVHDPFHIDQDPNAHPGHDFDEDRPVPHRQHPGFLSPRYFRSQDESLKPRLGVIMQPLTDQLAAYFGLNDRLGALVTTVMAETPAQEAGLEAGDVIISVADEDVESPRDVQRAIAGTGEAAFDLEVIRRGESRTFTIPVVPAVGESLEDSSSDPGNEMEALPPESM